MNDTCYVILNLVKPLRVAGSICLFALVIVAVWAARSVPNEVRRRYGVKLLLRGILPGRRILEAVNAADKHHVIVFARRMRVVVLGNLVVAAKNVVFLVVIYRCLN